MTSALVGLGEGIGNVLMGMPVVDALHDAGYSVALSLKPTPASIVADLFTLVRAGRPWLARHEASNRYDVAALTHWWVRLADELPSATKVLVGPQPNAEAPEILTNLETIAPVLAIRDRSPRFARAELFTPEWEPVEPGARPMVVIHPGCKPDPEWRAAKVYPRWAEATLRLKQAGFAFVVVVGGEDDRDLFVGEPHCDLRGMLPLAKTAEVIRGADVVVSGDSGIHHLAVALGKPTVALFGATSVTKAMHPNPRGPAPVVVQGALADIDPVKVAELCGEAMLASASAAA